MSGYRFFRILQVMVVAPFLILLPLAFCVIFTVKELSLESSYRQRYGSEWQAQYEKNIGSLSKAHERVGAASLGIIAIPSLTYWVYRAIRKDPHRSHSRKNRRESRMSNTERVMQARSRALLWNYLGLLGIAVGMLLAIFRWHIFATHENEFILGMFVFTAGYICVMAGCWWWLRAKDWSEALVIIGTWPLVIVFIPFVRIIVLRVLLASSPVLLLLVMLLTPAILFTVVATLPDKSGVNRKQRRPMNWKDIGEKRQS
jgi:hypothetical protein